MTFMFLFPHALKFLVDQKQYLSINSTYHTITDVNLISVSFRSYTNITCSIIKPYNVYPAAKSLRKPQEQQRGLMDNK